MPTYNKYNFNGEQLGKAPLILAVMKKYVEDNNPTYEQLKQDFQEIEKSRSKSKPLYITPQELDDRKKHSNDKRKRFFESDTEALTLGDGTRIFVSNQWSIDGTEKVIHFVNSKFDYDITDVIEHKPINDLYNDYLNKPNKGWISDYERFSAEVEQSLSTNASNYEADFIAKLWKSEANGIASAKPETLSNDEYKNLLNDLPEITALIFKEPTPNTLEQIYKWANKAKKEGKFNTIKRGVIHRVFAAADPKKYNTILNSDALRSFAKNLNESFDLDIDSDGNWAELNQVVTEEIKSKIEKIESMLVFNTFIWWLFEKLGKEMHDESLYIDENETDPSMTSELNKSEIKSKNLIYYGPPGTGKTYYTIEAAVKAAEPEKYKALEIKPLLGASKEQRKELTKLYKSLTDNDRIRFVTFHQSYGYEEFIEGLCAKTENGQLSYYEKDGIFKEICKDATKRVELDTGSLINTKGKVWKISIESTSSNPAKTYCYENNIAVVGWSDTGDLKNSEHNNYFNGLGKNDQSSLASFSQETNIGDLILCINSKSSVEAIGVITGAYFFNEKGVPTRPDFCHQIPVRWLAKDISVDLKSLNDSTNFHVPTFWLLSRFNVNNTLSYLLEKGINVETVHRVKQADNYVLIIDEINRGNISKIFGELITLIELSKRLGNDEALEVTLPYTGDKFSVPDNLYIIGTMNTADRSLAMMDTALRRRFDFIEMMPQPEFFKDKEVKGIKLEVLLETINKRIEVLYDREHTLGHAFLIPVLDALNTDDNTEEKAFSELKNTFKNKIIPLLEEYFFEDWNKISLVLGDNRKKTDKLAFVKTNTETYKEIFGSNHGLETYEDKKTTYTLADFNDQDSAWNNPKAYQTIYDEKVLNSLVDTSNIEENEDTASSVQ